MVGKELNWTQWLENNWEGVKLILVKMKQCWCQQRH